MSFIAICGGGGKSYICKKYPNLFLDIDDFIWSFTEYHEELEKAVINTNIEQISKIYEKIMKIHKKEIDRNKIVLGHHPVNAEWLELNYLFSIKPSQNIHIINIKSRPKYLQDIAINCWNNLSNAYIYNSYQDFESKLLRTTENSDNYKLFVSI